MDEFNNFDMTFSGETQSQGQGQSGEPLLRPFSENQGQEVASEATEGLGGLSAEELEDLELLWREVNTPAASEPGVPTGRAPLSESQEAWGRSQGVEEEVSGNGTQAGPSGVALLSAGPAAWDRSDEQQVLSGVGAQFEQPGVAPPSVHQQAYPQSQQHVSVNGVQFAALGFPPLPADLVARDQREGMSTAHSNVQQANFAPPSSAGRAQSAPTAFPPAPGYQQAYPQSQQHDSGNGAQIAPPRLAPPAAGFGEWGQRPGYVPAASMVGTAHVGVQQANLAQPFSAARTRSAPAGVAAPLAGHVAWDPRADASHVDFGGNAVHLGGQQANLAAPASANPAQFLPPGTAPLRAGHVVWDPRGEALRANARANDVHFPEPQANFARSLRPNQPTTLAYRPHQNLPPAHQYGGQAVMVPGVPLAPVPAPAPGPAPPVLNPFLPPPAPAAPRRTGRGKGNPYGPQNFPCAQCDFATGTKEKLVSHERIHFEPTHSCTFNGCIKRFWSDKDLKRHVDVHFPERAKKFTCESCGKEDKRKDNHKRHAETCKKRKRGGEGAGEGGEGEGEGGDGGS